MPFPNKPIGVYHEHQHWFLPLFAELTRRGVPFAALDARRHTFDPARPTEQDVYSLFVNRMSPSAFLRGAGNALFYTHSLLSHLARQPNLRVINGSEVFALEMSKAAQLSLLQSLRLPFPASRVINNPELAPMVAETLRFPIVVKANIGGSGAGIVRYDTMGDLRAAVAAQAVDLGVDGTALVQEYVPARGGHITRVETLGGKFLYAIRVHTTGATFNLCPADICQTSDGQTLARNACPADAPKTGLTVENYDPPAHVIAAVERIVQSAKIDVGGIEYMTDDRDGGIVYYDINALSNFVADARRVVDLDPHERLVDFLLREAGRG